jgi:hypothetical protein
MVNHSGLAYYTMWCLVFQEFYMQILKYVIVSCCFGHHALLRLTALTSTSKQHKSRQSSPKAHVPAMHVVFLAPLVRKHLNYSGVTTLEARGSMLAMLVKQGKLGHAWCPNQVR